MKRSMFVLASTASAVALLLSGCASRPTSAPVVDRSPTGIAAPKPPVAQPAPVPGPAVSAAPGGAYQVKRGDTLYSIALDHGIDPRDLREWNRLENPDRLQPGQALRVTPPEGSQPVQPPVQIGAARGAGQIDARPLESRPLDAKPQDPKAMASRPPETRPGAIAPSAAVKNDPKALRLPYSSENLAMLQKGEQQAAQPAPQVIAPPTPLKPVPAQPAAAAAEPRDGDAIEFIWPARGKLLAGFSEPTSKGVDIGGKPGDPVVAAASGRVIYIGTGIRGYGKLIVIKHDNNYNSVYAHNREILVKQDQAVTRGQQIAELGDTDTDSPKLHFEIRKSGKPVDPVKYLPPS